MTDLDKILSMTPEEQDADFRQRVRALYSPEEADWLLDPGPEEDEYDDGPDWREWQEYREHQQELDDWRAQQMGVA